LEKWLEYLLFAPSNQPPILDIIYAEIDLWFTRTYNIYASSSFFGDYIFINNRFFGASLALLPFIYSYFYLNDVYLYLLFYF